MAFVNRGEDLLGTHFNASPLLPPGSETLDSEFLAVKILLLCRNQMGNCLAVSSDSHRLSVLNSPQ